MAQEDDTLALASGLVVAPGPPTVYARRCGDGGRCELRLAVRVGSALETEAERGFAHFLEHLAFQATTRYGAGEIVEWLRALGSAYGRRSQNLSLTPPLSLRLRLFGLLL